VQLYGAHVLRLEADRIRHSEDYWDAGAFQRQIEQGETEGPARNIWNRCVTAGGSTSVAS
jgi:hypothetical protein